MQTRKDTTRTTRSGETKTTVSIDGRIVRGTAARISVHDWGFRFGWGAFETIRIREGRPVFLSQHLERLTGTAEALLLTQTGESAWWRREIRRAIKHSRAGAGALNLYWTRGEAPSFSGHRVICIRPVPARQRNSCTLWVAPWPLEPRTPGIGAKTLAYLPYTFSAICAQAAGFDDAVLLNARQCIIDGGSASVFVIEKGRLLTPPTDNGALPGITRGAVLDQAKRLGIPARVGTLPLKRVLSSDAVFLTSALRGLRLVRVVGTHRLPVSPEARRIVVRLRRALDRAALDDLASFTWQAGKR